MLDRKTLLRSGSLASHELKVCSPSSSTPAPEMPTHPHVSVYRSLYMEIRIHSPSIKYLRYRNTKRSLPVFGDQDRVSGYVILSPSCAKSGRLSISLEGTFSYSSPQTDDLKSLNAHFKSVKRKHVFFSTSTSLSVPTAGTRSAFCDAFTTGVRRRPRSPSLKTPTPFRHHSFTFHLPHGSRPGEELPPSFSSLADDEVSVNSSVEVTYMVSALWEPNVSCQQKAILKAPILFQPDTDFQSLDGLSVKPEFWLEMPLKSDRPIPFQCAITLPNPLVYFRPRTVPYFVVFKTTPRSSSLAREIAADATISISLLRCVTISEPVSLPPTPPSTPVSSSEDLNTVLASPKKLLKLVAKSASPTHSARNSEDIPVLPVTTTLSESRTLTTNMFIGFPKRPRHRCQSREHPSLKSYSLLPDGLYKGKFQLNKNMMPGVDWAGISVKYYLDVSVLVGQEELRARVPIRVC